MAIMKLEKQKAFIIHVIYYTFILGLVYIAIKYILPLLMPFILGIVVALIFRRPIDIISNKTHIKRTFLSIIILLLFYGLLILLISMLGVKVFVFLKGLLLGLPQLYKESIQPAFQSSTDNLIQRFPAITPYINDFLNNISDSISSFLTNASSSILGMVTGLAGQLPLLLIRLIFTIVATFFFTIDYYRITDFILRQFSNDKKDMLLKIKNNGIGTLGKFIRAYSVIIFITFLELTIGLKIMGIPNAVLFAGLIAFIDILPILGTGGVIIPWSIISFVMGNTKVGIGMLILYIVITCVRQVIEPKIVGQQIGLHPLITLILMFVGLQLMGLLGLLLLPIIATLIKKLNDDGTIHLFK